MRASVRACLIGFVGLVIVSLAACGGSSSSGSPGAAAVPSGADPAQPLPPGAAAGGAAIARGAPSEEAMSAAPAPQPISEKSAFRLLQQATFGPTEAAVADAMPKGYRRWIAEQFVMPVSSYGYRDRDAIHKWNDRNREFCDQFTSGTPARDNCWRDWFTTDLIKLDFFKQATLGTDQLRQRMAHALAQITVVSGVEISGTYGLADYHQMLRDRAFLSYRDVLIGVTTHPVMGEYLNMVDNEATDPNENFARELLQLFSIGTCELNSDGTLKTGQCVPTYNNAKVREYAFALTGWTYPAGGVSPWCNPRCDWKNPTYLKGAMVAVPAQHDRQPRSLLSGVSLAAGRTPAQALNGVVDSLMMHPNMAPFVSKLLIQFFVTSNPTPGYVARVANAFVAGRFETFGTGVRGDLQATLAAILLDAEARDDNSSRNVSGKLREPILMMTSAVRALNGFTDGEYLGQWGWGSSLSQPVFNSPSVFNFYSPDYPLPGAPGMVAPQFQLVNANTALGWYNFANDLVFWWYNKNLGQPPKADMEGTIGTRVNYAEFERDAADSTKLIDRLDRLLTGGATTPAGRAAIKAAVDVYTSADTWLTDANNQSSWQRERVKTAAYLLLSSAFYQVQR